MALEPAPDEPQNQWTTAQVTVTVQFVGPARAADVVHRPWTLMVYMAGDNGRTFDTKSGRIKLMAPLEEAGYQDLSKMGAVGTTAQCAVTCLFDTPKASYLVEVRQGKRFTDNLVQSVKPVNTGDPDTLKDFIVRSVQNYPADHYALVLWGHGAGWMAGDTYATVRSADPGPESHDAPSSSTHAKLRPGPEKTSLLLAFDDSSCDGLDAADLRKALGEAEALTGTRLDLIGMDLALMAMIEGARELAPFADYFIGSQEVEPMDGWPYAPILTALNTEPGMTPGALADKIVLEYAKSYNAQSRAGGEAVTPDHTGAETVTLSAITLAPTARTEDLVKALVEAILARQDDANLKSLVMGCVKNTLVFQDKNYRDLGDFAARLVQATKFESFPDMTAAAKALAEQLNARGADAPVLRVAFRPRYAGARGLSVYLPSPSQPSAQREKALAIYRSLLFPQATGWDRLLEWIFSEF